MSYQAAVFVVLLASGLEASEVSELHERSSAEPVLVEDLTTTQPAGLVPVTSAQGNVELRRAIVVDTIAPSNPQVNDLWIDASAAGNYRTCIYIGSGWIETDGSGESCGGIAVSQHSLVVSITGSGAGTVSSQPEGISCGVDCVQSFTHGEAVQLDALPGPDSLFVGWSGCSTELAPAIAVLMEGDRFCGAEFAATSSGVSAADWSATYPLYFDFDDLLAAGATSAAKLVPNLGTAGPTCDLRQYGSNLPIVLSASAQQGNYSLNLQSLGSGVNQRLGVRTQSDATNGSCDVARTGNPGTDYGTFSYHIRFQPRPNTEAGATISRVSEVANGGPGGWAVEWQESGTMVGRTWNGSTQTSLVSAPNSCPAGAWCVVSLIFDDELDTLCLYVNGPAAACTGLTKVTEPATGTGAYYRFGYASSAAKLDGLIDESGLVLGAAYSAEEACRVCSCGIDGSLCSCDPLLPNLYAASAGDGLNAAQCGGCALPACNSGAP